jgi:Protein of unknown function (DUF3592)
MGRIFVGIAVALLGIGMIVGCWFTTQSTLRFLREGTKATGTVVDFSTEESRDNKGKRKTMYAPVVEFQTADGQSIQFTSASSSSSPSYDRGDKVPVRYLSATPEQARIDSFMSNWGPSLMLGVIGLLATLAGYGLFKAGVAARRASAWLKQNGKSVQARVIGASQNPKGMIVNGVAPWHVRAEWQHPTTGQTHVLVSKDYRYDPTPMLKREHVVALINPDDPTQHELDTSFLPAKM